jgi:hypothetical protein
MLQRTTAAKSSPVRYASIDVRFGWSDDAWKRLTAAAPPSWMLYREKLAHESHNSMQFIGTYIGLRELFADYSMLTVPIATTSILPAYEKLATAYGARMTPPQPLLHRVVEDLLMEGRGTAAHAALDTLTTAYGAPTDAASLREQVADVERRPPPTETVEGLLATPFPSADTIRDYVGEWEGEQWINPESKHRLVLRIAVEGQDVVATLISWPEPDVELPQREQYLKVTPQGLTFGHMNGMRPRGMLLHEATRDGDTLRGTVRFGGINFTPPDGIAMPKHEFVLRKK